MTSLGSEQNVRIPPIKGVRNIQVMQDAAAPISLSFPTIEIAIVNKIHENKITKSIFFEDLQVN
jgi:hypothetical protein